MGQQNETKKNTLPYASLSNLTNINPGWKYVLANNAQYVYLSSELCCDPIYLPYRPPGGCLQYLTENSGTFTTFNYRSNVNNFHLVNQRYAHIIFFRRLHIQFVKRFGIFFAKCCPSMKLNIWVKYFPKLFASRKRVCLVRKKALNRTELSLLGYYY